MPGRSSPPGFWNVAWTWTFRVASSTTELIAVILPEAQHPREGSPDHLALDGGPDLADAGLRLLGLGGDLVVLGLGDDSLVEQLPRPIEIEAHEVALGLDGRELGPLLAGVELDEH